ncbi:MAG: hypothetical protein KDG89_01770 [Geminicoccaceae bacterium]|nr:hypothetical protein [Geminicoccaceae bacterium]
MSDGIDDLVPLYVNGTATAPERARVEAAARADPEVAEAVRFWRGVEAAVAAEDGQARPEPGGWGRLERALDAETGTEARAGVVRLADRFPRRRPVLGVSPWWRPAAVAACLLLAAQSAFLLRGGAGAPGGAPEGSLATASGEVGTATGEAGRVLQVTFRPDATEESIRTLLLDVGAVLVDGPSAIGVYRIAFATPEARAAGLKALLARSDVIESAAK